MMLQTLAAIAIAILAVLRGSIYVRAIRLTNANRRTRKEQNLDALALAANTAAISAATAIIKLTL